MRHFVTKNGGKVTNIVSFAPREVVGAECGHGKRRPGERPPSALRAHRESALAQVMAAEELRGFRGDVVVPLGHVYGACQIERDAVPKAAAGRGILDAVPQGLGQVLGIAAQFEQIVIRHRIERRLGALDILVELGLVEDSALDGIEDFERVRLAHGGGLYAYLTGR